MSWGCEEKERVKRVDGEGRKETKVNKNNKVVVISFGNGAGGS